MDDAAAVIRLQRDQEDDAVAVLAEAFQHDPVMNYVFHGIESGDDARLRELFRFSCRVRFDIGWPLMGVQSDGELLAVAGIDEPGEAEWPQSLSDCYQEFARIAGPEAVGRLGSYASLPDKHRPKEPHFFLGMIGVHPKAQGKGYARLLLDWLHRASETHPTSNGVALDTDSDVNVSIYEHFGYEVVGRDDLVSLTVSTMYRPDSQ
ncbi:MAG: GNAT family N-acetyltransferase [Chloroflexi bacterium]|nr:GNAT family N-acetyltransferase [Chloroflexota bacterium]MDA1226743.1 GNAT family N-acetyltransferase [Chloroflexota bacterium]